MHVLKAPEEFIDPAFFDDRIILKDPADLHANELEALWQRIRELQEHDDWEDRFHWTHVCDKKGNRKAAKYLGRPPEEKQASRNKRRTAAARRPPQAARQARANENDRAGEEDEDRADGVRGAPGRGKGSGSKGQGGKTKKTTGTKTKHGGKGKERAHEESESDSAKSSRAGGEDESDPELPDSSGSSVDDGSGACQVCCLFLPSLELEIGPAKPGPSRKHTRKTRAAARTETSSKQPPEPRAPQQRAPAPRRVAPPMNGELGGPDPDIPPSDAAIAEAKYAPPQWIGHDPARVFSFLWAIAGEKEYRLILNTWRHMVSAISHFLAMQMPC